MPFISERSLRAFESPIRKLTPFAEKAKAEGTRILHLNIGQPDILAPQVAIESLHDYDKKLIEYGPSEGILEYRSRLVEYYKTYDLDVSTEDIIVTTGASEALLLTLYACFDEGDEVIVPEPFYANYNGICAMAGVNIVPISSRLEDGFPLPSKEELLKAITPKTKGFLLCNPNNPTGKVYSKETLAFLTEMVAEKNLYLLIDEVYREFCYNEARFISGLWFDRAKENVIVLDSISKRYSSCGVRVGCLVTRNASLRRNILKFAQLRLCPPMIGQYYAIHTLDADQTYFREVLAEYARRKEVVVDRLRENPEIKYSSPEGAFYVFAKLPVSDTDEFCRWMLTDFRYQNTSVMLAPGSGFYSTEGMGKDEVRIAYVLKEEDLHLAMDCLLAGVTEYKKLEASRSMVNQDF